MVAVVAAAAAAVVLSMPGALLRRDQPTEVRGEPG
jgi:hypothetical protein